METRRIAVSSFGGSVALLFVAFSAVGRAQEIERVSVDSNGVEGNDHSEPAALSADGRYVVFGSRATNLVSGDTNGWNDVFVRDRVMGTTERVSVDSSGGEGVLGGSYYDYWIRVAISSDGQIVAFDSDFVNLVASDTNDFRDVFIHDRTTGVTERESVDSSGAEADAASYDPAISADGRCICFGSEATNLVPGDTNGAYDVFVHDRSTGITERVSVDSSGIEANDASYGIVAISADGRYVAFSSSASNLVPGDTNGYGDVFVRDRATGAVERISVDSNGVEGDGSSWAPSISADGSVVAFQSEADNLVAGDLIRRRDVFVRDRNAGTTERVSFGINGQEADGDSDGGLISADGMLVAFSSWAYNIVAGDDNRTGDAFLHDRAAGTTKLLRGDAPGQLGGGSGSNSISADGKNVAFTSTASNLVANDTNRKEDVFVCMLDHVKSHSRHYGAGLSGTSGIPSITPSADPTLGTTISITVSNSLGAATDALLVVGYQRTQLPSVWGGDLLVEPSLVMLLTLDASGFTMTGGIPNDPILTGFVLDLQALELDAGASRGVSFTDGLELVLGD